MIRTTYPPERRGFGRRESFLHAVARFPGRPPEPCIVRNFSDSGALLEFPIGVEPPARFRLVLDAKGLDTRCEVRRRIGDSIGVSFVVAGTGDALLDEPTLALIETADELAPPVRRSVKPTTRFTGDDVRRQMFGRAL